MTLVGFIFCVLILQLTGCQKEKPVDTSNIDPIATDILTAISEGRSDKIYDTYFTPEYRKKLSREDWKGMIDVYRKRLGAFKSLQRKVTNAIRIDGDAEGSFGFAVTWEKGTGEVVLNMSLREKWLLVNIQIDSAAVFNDENIPRKPATEKVNPPGESEIRETKENLLSVTVRT